MFEAIERVIMGEDEADSSSDDSEMQHHGIGVRMRPVSPGNGSRRNVKRQRSAVDTMPSLQTEHGSSGLEDTKLNSQPPAKRATRGVKPEKVSNSQRRPASGPGAAQLDEANTNNDATQSRLAALTERIMIRSNALRSRSAGPSRMQKAPKASNGVHFGQASCPDSINQLDTSHKTSGKDPASLKHATTGKDSKDTLSGLIAQRATVLEQPKSPQSPENALQMRSNPTFESDASYSELSEDAAPIRATQADVMMGSTKDETLAAVVARQQDVKTPTPHRKAVPQRAVNKRPQATRHQAHTKGKAGGGKVDTGRKRNERTAKPLAVNTKEAGVSKNSARQKRTTVDSGMPQRAKYPTNSRISDSEGVPRDSTKKAGGRLDAQRPGHDRQGKQKDGGEDVKALTSKERRALYWEKQQEKEAGVKNGNFKKNRPGQRTRQKIAAKVHGKDAKHLKAGDSTVAQAAGAAPLKAGKTKEESRSIQNRPEVEHPSWLAKQRERGMLAAAPKGKKVVFGEDGPAHTTVQLPSGATATAPTERNTAPRAARPSSAVGKSTAPWKGAGGKGGGSFSKPNRAGAHSNAKGKAGCATGNSGISDASGRDISVDVGALGGSKGASGGLQKKLSGVGNSGGAKAGLHPSWVAKVQAKKDEKEKMKAALSGKLAVAKKTTFDD